MIAGWSSLVARRAHNPKVVGSNPTPATIENPYLSNTSEGFFFYVWFRLITFSLLHYYYTNSHLTYHTLEYD